MQNVIRSLTILAILAACARGQHPSVGSISTHGAGGSCTCIANSEEHDISIFISAHHVTETCPRYGRCDIYLPEIGKSVMGRLITMNSTLDASAIMGRYVPGLPAARIADRRPAVGDWICSDGFPARVTPRSGRDGLFKQLIGRVTQITPEGIINTSYVPSSGQSGAGAFNELGQLCGLTNGYYGQQARDGPIKSFGPWFALTDDCPAMQWLIKGWDQHAGHIKNSNQTGMIRRLFSTQWAPGGG